MVFIHGGAFFFGSGSEKWYSADYLIDQDVIVVTLNYRLHSLGMLILLDIVFFSSVLIRYAHYQSTVISKQR